MAVRHEQILTKKLDIYLKMRGFQKAAIARKAGIDPEDFYAILANRKLLLADSFQAICMAMEVSAEEIAAIQLPYERENPCA